MDAADEKRGDDAREGPLMAAEALREELRVVEDELAGLRRTVADLRRDVAEQAQASADPNDFASAITAVDEQEALVAALEVRREKLRQRIGAS